MRLKGNPIKIEPGAAFAGDGFQNRKEAGDTLTEFVKSANEPIVICIDAPWGQGKTTFLQMWEQDLKDKKIPVLYFNAWENDFSDNALTTLIGEISDSIKKITNKDNSDNAHKCLEGIKKYGTLMLKKALPAVLKIGTAGILNLDTVTEQTISNLTEAMAKEQIEHYEKAKIAFSSFKDSLASFAKTISEEEKNPLVFIIDELDRCRPNFAIEILEKVKHFFNVKNIVFILGADKTQLGHAIRAIYGQGLDVSGYLRRFIDFNYTLPTPQKGDFVKVLFQRFGFNEYFVKKTHPHTKNEEQQALQLFADLFHIYDLTLREQEHCCSMLSIAIKMTPESVRLFPLPLCFLIVLKTKKPDLYNSFINGKASHNDLMNNLREQDHKNILAKGSGVYMLEAYLATCRCDRNYDPIVADYRAQAQEFELNKNDPIKKAELDRTDTIIRIIQKMDYHDEDGVSLEFLLKKMELFTNFGIPGSSY